MNGKKEAGKEKETRTNGLDLAFSGAGFLGCYFIGVAEFWRRHVPRDRTNRVAGTSTGSIAAAYFVLDMPLSAPLRLFLGVALELRNQRFGMFNRSNQLVDVLPRKLDETLPDDAHKRVGNQLHICITRLKDMKKVLVNEFETKKDLIDALVCSCFLPVWSGTRAPTYKGEKYIDGGFTDCLPAFDEDTIQICCLAGNADVAPRFKMRTKLLMRKPFNMPMYFNYKNVKRGKIALTPITAEKAIPIIKDGFEDTKNFLLTNDLIQCDRCYNNTDPSEQPVYSRPTPASERCNVGDANSLSPDDNESFRKLLNGKLARHTSNLVQGKDPPVKSNNPEIKISAPEESARRKGSVQSLQGDRSSAKERRRRSTCARLTTALEDRFISSLEPLPSCPPSLTLNRHCKECGRLRERAKTESVEEFVRAELDKLAIDVKRRKIVGKNFTSPMKRLKQIGIRNSYNFTKFAV